MFDACTSPPARNNPWESLSASETEASSLAHGGSPTGQFEDSFVASLGETGQTRETRRAEFEKLDDSEEYLEKLERKLKKLQTPSKRDSLLKALAERRSDENRRLTVSSFLESLKPVLL
jgi:hypothetical protein